MDRIDLHIPVERPTLEQLLDTSSSNMTSESMRQQVIMATAMQQKRYESFDFNSNGAVPHKACLLYTSLQHWALGALAGKYGSTVWR